MLGLPGTLDTSRQRYLDGFLAGAGKSRRAGQIAPAMMDNPAGLPVPEVGANGHADGEKAVSQPPGLSWEERVKAEGLPFDAFPSLWACARTDRPPSAEDRFRFQWFGLFHQGPERDACVVRVRLPGGRLRGFQLRGLAEITQAVAGGAVEMNPQGGLDLPGVPVRACAEVLRRVEEIGLRTRGTGGDCVRAVRGGEGEGARGESSPPVDDLVCELEQTLAQTAEFGNLPGACEIWFQTVGKWSSVGSGPEETGGVERVVFEGSRGAGDGEIVPRIWRNEAGPDVRAWRMLLPGSGDLGVGLASEEIVPVCVALLRTWGQEANRQSREQAALGSFCAQLGTEELRESVEREIGHRLAVAPPGGGTILPAAKMPAGVEMPGGRLLSGQLVELAGLLDQHGGRDVRLVAPGYILVPTVLDAVGFETELREILWRGREG